MSALTSSFLITGASGAQGGAVATQLLAAGHKVHILVRDPTKPSVQKLVDHGAVVFEGSFDDQAALANAARGTRGVFLNTTPTRPSETELRHASNIIAAAKEAGVFRCVYTSVTRAEEHESFPTWNPEGLQAGYWRAKTRIQEMVQTAGWKEGWTILQPAWMMGNWVAPVSLAFFPELKAEGTMAVAFAETTRVDLTSPDDIGRFAVRALTEAAAESTMKGKVIKVAGDTLTTGQIAERMSEVSGKEVRAIYRSDEEIEDLKEKNPIVASQLWQRLDGSKVDLEDVKSWGVKTSSFKEFLELNKEALLQTLG